jgi:hypothetical protein
MNAAVPSWLPVSIVLSVVVTVVLNAALRIVPGAGQRIEDSVRRATERSEPPADEPEGSRVHVVFPWKLMLIGSLVLTVALNVLVRLLS